MAMAKTSLIVGFGRREVVGTRPIRVGEDASNIRLIELVASKPCLESAWHVLGPSDTFVE